MDWSQNLIWMEAHQSWYDDGKYIFAHILSKLCVFYCEIYIQAELLEIINWIIFPYSYVCNRRINRDALQCETEDCVIQGSSYETVITPYGAAPYKDTYEISMHVSDHTGSLEMCNLSSSAAERILAMTATRFLELSEIEWGQLKWRLLLERCKVKVLVKLKTPIRFNTTVTVLDCVKADSADVFANIKAY